MGRDLAILTEMILGSATIPLTTRAESGKRQVVLDEPDCAGSTVTVFGLPEDAIVIKPDAFPPPNHVFANTKHECRRADFAIVAEVDGKAVIIFIEMKSGEGRNSKIVQQLKGASCVMAYCREIGRQFWDEPDFLDSAVYRYVTMRSISITKNQSRIDSSAPLHDTVDKALRVSQKKVQFNRLARAGA